MIRPDSLKFATPFNDLIQAAHHTACLQREINFNADLFPITAINHVK
jgi:hypothetical protein